MGCLRKGTCKYYDPNCGSICTDYLNEMPCGRYESHASSGQLYRKLELGEEIKVGDQWLNHDWEVGGPWYTVEENNKNVGVKYEAHFREMRRSLTGRSPSQSDT